MFPALPNSSPRQQPNFPFLVRFAGAVQHRQSIWMQVLGLVEAGNLYFGYSNLLCYIQAWTGQLTLQVA